MKYYHWSLWANRSGPDWEYLLVRVDTGRKSWDSLTFSRGQVKLRYRYMALSELREFHDGADVARLVEAAQQRAFSARKLKAIVLAGN